jgi:hypothetical protein
MINKSMVISCCCCESKRRADGGEAAERLTSAMSAATKLAKRIHEQRKLG